MSQKKEFLIRGRKERSPLFPLFLFLSRVPKALRSYFISCASHCISTRSHRSVNRGPHGRGPSVARKSSATSPVDESGPSNRDLLWKVSSSRLTGKRRFRRRIKLMVHPRGASCTPAALLLLLLLFMPPHFPGETGKPSPECDDLKCLGLKIAQRERS